MSVDKDKGTLGGINYIKPESSAHWYSEDGTPHHGATLRDARKQDLLPSVTTVLTVKAAPGLEAWKQNQLLLAALTFPEEIKAKGDLEVVAKQIVHDAKAQVSEAASRGTIVHDGIECILNNEPWDKESEQLCAMDEWITANVLESKWLEQVVVNKEVGYAGRSDGLIEHQEHGHVVVDWKTQNCKQNAKGDWVPRYYDKFLLQLAAYRECVENKPPVLSVVINANVGEVYEKLWTEEETQAAWDAFKHIHAVWCYDRNYFPAAKDQEVSA